ncbi:MAG TPA: sugar phosphate isomerase/epimerase [Opitutaceae bacterium]|nr:sugar phosphate isomerase/epimerase [Opitutaceae bacterium]
MYSKAFSTLGCPDLTLEQVIELGRRFRIDAVELRALEGQLNLPDYFTKRYGSPEKLRSALADTPRIIALDTSFKLIGSSAADRAQLLAFIPWAEAIGARWLRVFDGGATLDAAVLAEAKENLQWWRQTAAARRISVDLMIETHDVLLDAARIETFTTAMGALPVALLWDAHHTWKKGGEDPVRTWRSIRDRVVHVHVKDSVSNSQAPLGFTYVEPGAGAFPIAPLRKVLAAEFDGCVSLEWEKVWHPDLGPLEGALRAAETSRWW